MTHISKDLAKTIAENIAHAKFAKQIEEATLIAEIIANELLDSLIDCTMVAVCPNGYLPKATRIEINVMGRYYYVDFGTLRPMPFNIYRRANQIEFDNPIWLRYKDAADKCEAIATDRKAAIEELEKHIFTFRTVNKLMREWAEITAFIPDYAKTTKTAIAVPIAQLNARFGLPPEKISEGAAA